MKREATQRRAFHQPESTPPKKHSMISVSLEIRWMLIGCWIQTDRISCQIVNRRSSHRCCRPVAARSARQGGNNVKKMRVNYGSKVSTRYTLLRLLPDYSGCGESISSLEVWLGRWDVGSLGLGTISRQARSSSEHEPSSQQGRSQQDSIRRITTSPYKPLPHHPCAFPLT